MEEIIIPNQNTLFPKLPYFQQGQRITNEQLNLLAGGLKGDNVISSILNSVRVISSNFSYNPEEYEVTVTNGVLNKNFGRTKFSIPTSAVSIIGIDVSMENKNGVFSIKLNQGVVILDYMSYVFNGVTFPLVASAYSGVLLFAFTEEYSDQDYNQFLNLDTDKIVKTTYNSKKTYKMKLYHIPIFKILNNKFSTSEDVLSKSYDTIDLLIEDVAPKESFPICGYTKIGNELLIRNLFKNMPLFPTPEYITTTDILGKWLDLGSNFSLVAENGDRILSSLDQSNLENILPVNSVVRLNKLLYRKVIKVVSPNTVQLDRGYYIPNTDISRDLLVKMPVEKALSLETVMDGEVAKYEIGEIKYFYMPSTSRNWFRLSSKTRKLKKANYPDFVPYLYKHPLMVSGTFKGTPLSANLYTEWVDKFEINYMKRTKDSLTIYFSVNPINKSILQALLDDQSTRKYIDPEIFIPRTVTIGETPIDMEIFKKFPSLTSSQIANIQKKASWDFFLKYIYLEPGTYPIQNVDIATYSISINLPLSDAQLTAKYQSLNASNQLQYTSEVLKEIIYGSYPDFYLEEVFVGASHPNAINLKGSLVQFFPHRFPSTIVSGEYNIASIVDKKIINGVLEQQDNPPDWIEADNVALNRVKPSIGNVSQIYIANYNKFRTIVSDITDEVLHVAVPGNGYKGTVLPNGTMTNGGYEGVVGAINGWEKYVVPGYAHIFIGNYIEE